MYFLKKKNTENLREFEKKKSLWITSKVYSRTHGESGVSLRHKRIKKCLAKNNTAECIFLKSENLSNKEIEKLSNNFFSEIANTWTTETFITCITNAYVANNMSAALKKQT